jgi:hypothetical protein
MQLAHAALKLADFGLYFGRPEFVVEFQAERDYDLQRREMNRQNAIRVGNTLYLFREPQDRIDYALVRALADEKALGLPCEKRCITASIRPMRIDAMPSRTGRFSLTER